MKQVVDESFDVTEIERLIDFGTPDEATVLDLRDIYHDTEDLRLARSGVTVRWRDGDGWTVKLPRDASGPLIDRDEVSFAGSAGAPPDEATALVASFARSAGLREVATVEHQRTTRRWRDAAGTVMARIDDDRVRGRAGDRTTTFREIELELAPSVPEAVVARLAKAMPHGTPAVPKVVRVLGEGAEQPPDVVAVELGRHPTGATVIHAAIASSVLRLLQHVPLARLGDDPEGVHQARVATRRLRSDLRTFAPLLERDWSDSLRGELAWLADELGLVRDSDVLAVRISAALDRHAGTDPDSDGEIVAALALQRTQRREALIAHLADERAVALYDRLVEASRRPVLRKRADRAARSVLPRLVERSWNRLHRAVEGLETVPTEDDLHRVRLLAKRVRYAAEAVAPGLGRRPARFASAAATIQDSLGDLHDAAVAAAWLRSAAPELTPSAAFRAGMVAQRLLDEAAEPGAGWRRAYKRMQRDIDWLTPG